MKQSACMLLPLALIVSSCYGFQSSSRASRRPTVAFRRANIASSSLALAPEHLNDIYIQSQLMDSQAWTYLADAAQATLDAGGDGGNMLTDALQGVAELVKGEETVIEKAVEAAVQSEVDIAADEGWWAAYLSIFRSALLFVHDSVDQPLRNAGMTETWGISIAIFTASVRSLLVPLSFQQSKSSEYVKALKPYVTEIKEKFKDNKDQQNRAMGKLYEDANQNPLAGCLVSIVQLPIFLGLYRGIRNLAQEGRIDEPFLWIPSLQGPVSAPDYRGLDWLTTGWIDGVPQMGWETTLAFLVMPVILVLGQSLTMSILSPPIDDSMGDEEKEQMEKSQVILKFLPLLIGFFSLQVPAGLTIYWFTSNGFTLAQSLAVRAYYKANPPQIELPDYWDALDDMESMTPEEQRNAAKAGISVGPKFEDLLTEAKFHVLVDRKALRQDNAAWQRIADESMVIPTEMQTWVSAMSSVATSDDDETTAPAAAAQASAAA